MIDFGCDPSQEPKRSRPREDQERHVMKSRSKTRIVCLSSPDPMNRKLSERRTSHAFNEESL